MATKKSKPATRTAKTTATPANSDLMPPQDIAAIIDALRTAGVSNDTLIAQITSGLGDEQLYELYRNLDTMYALRTEKAKERQATYVADLRAELADVRAELDAAEADTDEPETPNTVESWVEYLRALDPDQLKEMKYLTSIATVLGKHGYTNEEIAQALKDVHGEQHKDNAPKPEDTYEWIGGESAGFSPEDLKYARPGILMASAIFNWMDMPFVEYEGLFTIGRMLAHAFGRISRNERLDDLVF